MDAARMLDYLSREYGIRSREEFEEAAARIAGIRLGIFTTPFRETARTEREKSKNDEVRE